jgi:uncharacterized protein (TIGR03437 family)
MLRSRRIAAAVVVAAAMVGALADSVAPRTCRAAEKEKPNLERIEPTPRAFKGGVIDVIGTGFGEATPITEVSVKVGDEAGTVSAVEPTRIQVILPFDIAKGKYPLVITVRGTPSNKITVEVRDEKERIEKTTEDAQTELGPTGGVNPVKVITLDPPEALTEGGNTVVRVGGSADLPDGCVISLNLTFGSESLDQTTAKVQGQRIQASFGPYPKMLYPGIYYVEAKFNIHQQSRSIRQIFKEQFKEAKDAKAREVGADRKPLQVGGPGEIEAQARELRSYAKSLITKIRQLHRDLEVAYGAAGRAAFGKGGSVDEGAWEAWLDKRALASVSAEERSKQVSDMKARKDLLTQSGAFADGKWRDWLDGKWREELSSQQKAHTTYREKYLRMRDQDISEKLGFALDQLAKLSSYRSRELYEMLSIPASPNDPTSSPVSGGQIDADLDVIDRRLAEMVPGK